MKSIIYETYDAIKTRETGLSLEKIYEILSPEHFLDETMSQSLAKIQSELILDGRFISDEGKWDLKENHTIEEINSIKAQEYSLISAEGEDEEVLLESGVIVEEDPGVIVTADDDLGDNLDDIVDDEDETIDDLISLGAEVEAVDVSNE